MNVRHDSKKRQFILSLGLYQAVLLYAKKGKLLDFYHIYVPEPFRQKGNSAKILIEAFEYAKRKGFRVVPSCPFIAGDFLPRFPEYQSVVRSGVFSFIPKKSIK